MSAPGWIHDDDAQLGVAAREMAEWISDDLIAQTIRVWQRYYATPLSRDDAIGIIQSVGRLIGVLSRS